MEQTIQVDPHQAIQLHPPGSFPGLPMCAALPAQRGAGKLFSLSIFSTAKGCEPALCIAPRIVATEIHVKIWCESDAHAWQRISPGSAPGHAQSPF